MQWLTFRLFGEFSFVIHTFPVDKCGTDAVVQALPLQWRPSATVWQIVPCDGFGFHLFHQYKVRVVTFAYKTFVADSEKFCGIMA